VRLFGFEISLRKAAPQNLSSVAGSTWWNFRGPIRESFPGAWQQNVTIDRQPDLLASSVVYACVTGIAVDIAKMRIMLSQDTDGIWKEVRSGSPFLPVLRKPNHFQTTIQFIESWIVSELLSGNTYILKERDRRGVVTRLYVLDPLRVRPLVADDGSVFYQLSRDPLAQVSEMSGNFDVDNPVVPASEIIHDRICPLWHPLVGVSPLYAAGLSATLGTKIVSNSTGLFANASRPGGILTAPGHIQDDTALRLKQAFEANFSGVNVGRLAVLGDGLKFEPMMLTAENSQLAEQFGMTKADVALAFHYPIWKVTGDFPAYSSGPQALTLMYYTDCLQPLIEQLESCLADGMEFPPENNYGIEMDIDNLLRMDTQTLIESSTKGILGGLLKPDEGRFRNNLSPVPGGDTPYLQQQNFALSALAKRDALEDPFSKGTTQVQAPSPTPPAPPRGLLVEDLEFYEEELRKELVLT